LTRFFRPFIFTTCLGAAFLVHAQSSGNVVSSVESQLRAQHPAEALRTADAALKQAPGNANLWTLKGIACSELQETSAATDAYAHALRLSPDNLAALRGAAQIFDQEHDPRAVPLLRRILALSPGDTTAHEMLALNEQRHGNCHAAIRNFQQSGPALHQHPESMAAYGSCLQNLGDTQQALAIFQTLAAHFPQLNFARYDLAVILYQSRQYAAAIQTLQPLLDSGRADADTLSLASQAYEAMHDTPKAVAALREAIVSDPSNVNLYNSFAELCLDHDSYRVGIDMINAGLRLNPRAASLYLSRGLLYAQLSEYTKAQSDFSTAERLNPKQGLSAYGADVAELEKYHFDLDHSNAAVAALKAQIHQHPDSYLLHYLLAKLLSMQGPQGGPSSMADARNQAEIAVKLKPDFVAAHDLLARMELEDKNLKASAQQSREALQYDPNDRTAVYHLIAALRQSTAPEDRHELKAMVQKLAVMEKTSLNTDARAKRFQLVEVPPPSTRGAANSQQR